MFWIALLLTTGLVALAVILVVGRRSYLQLRVLVAELRRLLADAEAVGARLDPGPGGAGETGGRRSRA